MRKMHSLAFSIVQAKLKGIPYKLNYAVTYRCNARCTICNIWKKYADSPEKQKEELTLSEIDKIFKDFDLSWVSLTGGEPFLREDIADIALTVDNHNPHLHMLSIPTNGSFPEKTFKTAETVLEKTEIPNVFVTVSLDGDEPLHDRLRGVKGMWKKAKKTYELLNTIDNNRFRALLEFTISKHNAGHLTETLDSFDVTDYSRVVITAAHSSFFYNTEQNDLHDKASVSQVDEFLSLCGHVSIEGLFPNVYLRLLKKYLRGNPVSLKCVSGCSSFFLDPYGVLYPCISMDTPFGNLKESSLQSLLQTEYAQSILRKIKRGECSGCWTPCEAYQTILENLPKAAVAAYLV